MRKRMEWRLMGISLGGSGEMCACNLGGRKWRRVICADNLLGYPSVW
jgi:hypothetical protein